MCVCSCDEVCCSEYVCCAQSLDISELCIARQFVQIAKLDIKHDISKQYNKMKNHNSLAHTKYTHALFENE